MHEAGVCRTGVNGTGWSQLGYPPHSLESKGVDKPTFESRNPDVTVYRITKRLVWMQHTLDNFRVTIHWRLTFFRDVIARLRGYQTLLVHETDPPRCAAKPGPTRVLAPSKEIQGFGLRKGGELPS